MADLAEAVGLYRFHHGSFDGSGQARLTMSGVYRPMVAIPETSQAGTTALIHVIRRRHNQLKHTSPARARQASDAATMAIDNLPDRQRVLAHLCLSCFHKRRLDACG